jgi:hypothetical protein
MKNVSMSGTGCEGAGFDALWASSAVKLWQRIFWVWP